MKKTLICLTLLGKTLDENLELLKKYRRYIDIAELRVDHLNEEEQLSVRHFPAMIRIPCILTIRRTSDGGKFSSNEFSRTALFARALAFADKNPAKNFAYVDFEEYFHIPSLQDAALAFGVKIIRSCHNFEKPITDIKNYMNKMCKTEFEIPKIAFMPSKLSEVTQLFKEAKELSNSNHILCAMGNLGTPARILSYKLNSYLTYVSPPETAGKVSALGHIDPVSINEIYNFRNLDENTKICAVTGYPLKVTSSPMLHNTGYRKHKMNRVFIPLPSTSMEESLEFAKQLEIDALAVTVPFKTDAINLADEIDSETGAIGACNTIVRSGNSFTGFNTDAYGFYKALLEFSGSKKWRRKKTAIIGAGGAAHAVAYVLKQLGARVCIFNRTVANAKKLAERFGFEYADLSEENVNILEKYSELIVQTTNVGMHSDSASSKENNPIYFYEFKGHEYLYDLIYDPEITPVMKEAINAGCKVCNGFSMLKYQGYKQFKYFTGCDYE